MFLPSEEDLLVLRVLPFLLSVKLGDSDPPPKLLGRADFTELIALVLLPSL